MSDDFLTSDDEAAKLAAKQLEIDLEAGYRTMMSTPQARMVMWRQFEAFGIYKAAPSTEQNALAWNEGRRSIALQVLNDLQAWAPDLWDMMVVESRAREAQEKRQK
jgi:hypothetical protein